MRSDLLRRVRWTNVALALGALATLATVIAWPLTTSQAPTLPADTSRPLAEKQLSEEECDGEGAAAGSGEEAGRDRRGAAVVGAGGRGEVVGVRERAYAGEGGAPCGATGPGDDVGGGGGTRNGANGEDARRARRGEGGRGRAKTSRGGARGARRTGARGRRGSSGADTRRERGAGRHGEDGKRGARRRGAEEKGGATSRGGAGSRGAASGGGTADGGAGSRGAADRGGAGSRGPTAPAQAQGAPKEFGFEGKR